MPVFARKKLVIHEDCLSPAPGSITPGRSFITLNYTGPNPQNLYHQIKKLLNTIFKIDESEIQEKEVRWDRSKTKEEFSVKFEMMKDLDLNSFIHINVELSGTAKSSKEFGKEGNAKIKIEPFLRTEYPQDTFWQRSLIYEMFRMFYHRVIYKETREKYKKKCVELVKHFQSELKSFLNLLQKK
jgi:hypothetical protein